MSIFHDKTLKSVAEAAAKIMAETSHGSHPKTPKEKSLAALAHPKDKITHKDVLVGRGVLKKEDIEQLDEVGDTKAGRKALSSYVSKAITNAVQNPDKRTKGVRKATSRLYKDNYYGKKTNEEVESTEQEQLNEAFPSVEDAKKRMSAGKTATGTVTKTKTGLIHKRDFEHNAEDDDHPEKVGRPRSYGARQNYKRSTRVNESLSFTEMLELYSEHGIKVLSPIESEEMDVDGTTIEVIDGDKINGFVATTVEEEATEEEFNKELKDQQDSFAGKKKQPKVVAGKTTGVKAMPEEVELDEEYEYISEAEYLELDEDEQQLWEAVTSQSYSNLRDKKSKVPATEFGAKGTKTKVLDQIRHHEFRKTHSTGKNVYATDYKVGKKDTAEMMYRKKSGKKGQVPSQRAGLRRDRYNEEVEQIDELKYDTLRSYTDKAKAENLPGKDSRRGVALLTPGTRDKGVHRAVDRMKKMPQHPSNQQKEEVELDERTLTSGESKKKEEYVKGMKKSLSGFKQRYGERAKSVMYATATKMAKKD